MPTPSNVIAIGELLWDVFPNQQRLGGAPANFAIHCAQLAGDKHSVALVSAVGDDDLGAAALTTIGKTKTNTDLVSTVAHPTGRVNVSIDTVGAGDAFTAALVVGILEQRPLDETNERACRIAALVCSQNGATPKVPPSVLD